jgi:hypothetical protein
VNELFRAVLYAKKFLQPPLVIMSESDGTDNYVSDRRTTYEVRMKFASPEEKP